MDLEEGAACLESQGRDRIAIFGRRLFRRWTIPSASRYRLMPDGKPTPIESSSDMNGSMLGQQGRIRTRLAYIDHRAVGK